jgi:thiamine phosphate synthase YjbQ (UPF0047 family)
MVRTTRHRISTRGQRDAHDLTTLVAAAVKAAGQRGGIATVFVVGSTAAITTIEFESGAIADLNDVIEALAPRDGDYAHHARWGDDNGSSHKGIVEELRLVKGPRKASGSQSQSNPTGPRIPSG